MKFGENLKKLRKERDLSQEDFADKCGLHRTYIGGLERGERNPTLSTMVRIAKTFEINISQLLKDIK